MDNQIEIKSVESLPEYLSDSSMLSISKARAEELGKKCATRLEELKALRSNSGWEQDKERDFNAYHIIAENKPLPYKGYPNLACPLPRIGIDTLHANVLYTFGGQQGRFTVLPDFLSMSHLDSAERAAKYLTYVLNYESDLYAALDKADLDAQKYGVGYLKASYETRCAWETRVVTKEEVVPKVDELTGEVTRETKKRRKTEKIKKTIFDGVKVRRVHPECIYVSPFFEDLKDAVDQDYVFEVTPWTMRRVEEMGVSVDKDVPPFFSPEQVKKVKLHTRTRIVSNLERTKQQYDGFMVDLKCEQEPIELAEAHFRYDVNGDGLSEKVTVVFETSSGIVLRTTYGECRIVKLNPRPVDGRWYGESIRKAVESLILEWEAIHNQRVAKGQWSNLPFFFYKAGGRFNPQTLTLMPGKGYPLDDPASVSFPQPPSPDLSYFNEEKLLMDLVDRVLALGDVIQGVMSKDGSATEAINAQQRAGIRLATPINRISFALNELLGHIWELNKQCAPEIKEFKVVGIGAGSPVFDKITSSDYEAQVSFKLNMATLYDVQVLRDTALLNYRTFLANPLVMNNPASFYELTQNTMRAVGLEINIPKPEQAKAKSPWLEHDLLHRGTEVEPVIGEDADEHLLAHDALIRSEEFKNWPADAQQRMMLHRDKTMILKQTLEASNLNQSGIYEGPNPMGGADQQTPGFTASRNPTQTFNTMRVGETPDSMKQNMMNGEQGANAQNPGY